MKYDDLEKTKDLFDIPDEDVPSIIDDIDSEGISKETLSDDLTFGLSGEDKVDGQKEEVLSLDDEDDKKKKPKKKFKEKWASWSRRKKVLFILIPVLVLIIILAVVLWLVLREPEEVVPEPSEPEVIVQRDNYIYQDGVLVFLNDNDEEIGRYECNNKSEETCYVATYSNEDEFDNVKHVYEDGSALNIVSQIYQNNYVFIYDNEMSDEGVIILYNIATNEEEGTYSLVKGFSNSDFAIVKDTENRYGALLFSEDNVEEVFAFSYDYLGRLDEDSNIVAYTNNRYYIYNLEEERLSQGISYRIKSYNDEYIVVDDGGYYAYSYNGSLIFDQEYDFIELLDDYAVLIDRSNLYIRDYQNNKYNEEGVELDSNDYAVYQVYNNDKVLVETRRSYEVVINENVLDVLYTVNGSDRSKSIDLQDGIMSAKYDYISYYDDVLYFYQDEEKTEILGTYECSNSNNSDLTNCVVATDSFYSKNDLEEDRSEEVGWIPIFNERYVFILDTIDVNNPTIVLYDLEDRESLARYETVDSGSYTGENKVTFVDTEATYVMAQSKNDGNFGLIRIGDNVSKTIGFDYSSIEKFRDYYMVSTSSGTYQLYSNVGREITGEYGYQIVDYYDNYLKVVDNNKYYVYNFDGDKIGGTYNFVAFYEDYYVVIDTSNKLNIGMYDDPVYTLSETIDVGTTNYEGAYQINTLSNGGLEVIITSNNTTYEFDANGVLQNGNDPLEEEILPSTDEVLDDGDEITE